MKIKEGEKLPDSNVFVLNNNSPEQVSINQLIGKDKIIIIGLFSKNKKGGPLYNEDLHYTSSNKFYLGKSPPNMYGGEVLATIISNINNNSFVI